MRSRDQLLGVLVQLHGWHPDQANELIDNFAHELAEEIRQMDTDPGTRFAADMIDPKISKEHTP